MKIKNLIMAGVFSILSHNTAVATDALVGMSTTIINPDITIDVVNNVSFGDLRDTGGSHMCNLSGANVVSSCEVISGTPSVGLITINGLAYASVQVYGSTETSGGVTFIPKFENADYVGLGLETHSTNIDVDGSVDVKVMGQASFDSVDVTSGAPVNISTTVTVVYN